MKRRLFTILSALSLVLCITAIVYGARSHWFREGPSCSTRWGRNGHHTETSMSINNCLGEVCFSLTRVCSTRSDPPYLLRWHYYFDPDGAAYILDPRNPPPSENTVFLWHEFAVLRDTIASPKTTVVQYTLVLPHWILALASTAMPSVWLLRFRARWRRKLRERQGLCLTCGYDLRASPERCPECGTAVPSPVTSSAPSSSDPA